MITGLKHLLNFRCDHCDRSYFSSDQLERHVKMFHPNAVDSGGDAVKVSNASTVKDIVEAYGIANDGAEEVKEEDAKVENVAPVEEQPSCAAQG